MNCVDRLRYFGFVGSFMYRSRPWMVSARLMRRRVKNVFNSYFNYSFSIRSSSAIPQLQHEVSRNESVFLEHEEAAWMSQ